MGGRERLNKKKKRQWSQWLMGEEIEMNWRRRKKKNNCLVLFN